MHVARSDSTNTRKCSRKEHMGTEVIGSWLSPEFKCPAMRHFLPRSSMSNLSSYSSFNRSRDRVVRNTTLRFLWMGTNSILCSLLYFRRSPFQSQKNIKWWSAFGCRRRRVAYVCGESLRQNLLGGRLNRISQQGRMKIGRLVAQSRWCRIFHPISYGTS